MITVILTIWKRNNLEEQIEALLKQSVPPSAIWIYHCGKFIPPQNELIRKHPNIKYQHNSHDLGYFGRFSLGLSVQTPFLLVLDDDVIPTAHWISTCLMLCEKYNSIISPAGRVIPLNDYMPEQPKSNEYIEKYFIGDAFSNNNINVCLQDTFIDFGCTSWFIKTEWLNYFWGLPPFNLETGEDIHLSASCMIRGGIRTLCPYQNEETISGNLKREYGSDQFASWKQNGFLEKREKILKHLIDTQGWQPLLWKA